MKKLNYIYKIFMITLIITLSVSSMKAVLASKFNNSTNETYEMCEVEEGFTKKLSAGAISYINGTYDLSVSVDELENIYTSCPNNEEELFIEETKLEEEIVTEDITTEEEILVEEDIIEEEVVTGASKYSEYDIYLLAKIIMAEAEGESQYCKELVGQVIINRLNSDRHPNTMYDVIFANNGKTWQFSPCIPGGRWYRVEPNEACYEAAYTVLNASEPLTDALYFESCKGSSWHSRNLTLVIELEEDNTRFYK